MSPFQLVLFALIPGVLCEEYVKVILGDSFALPENCKSGEEGTLRQDQPLSRQVAAHRDRVWTPEESFKDRISQSSSLVFNRAVYTDSGVYVLTCGGRWVVNIHVEVVRSSDASVKEGEAVSLPCYYSTAVGTCWSMRWVKGRDDVFNCTSCDGKSCWASDDRLSLSADWLSHGDLSLNLQQARKSDERDYFCFIQREGRGETNGNPAAVRLKVSERNPNQITSASPPPPPVSPTQKPCEAGGLLTAVSITAVVGVTVGALVFWLLKPFCLRCASRGPGHDHVNGGSEPLNPHQHTNGFPRPNDTQADSVV